MTRTSRASKPMMHSAAIVAVAVLFAAFSTGTARAETIAFTGARIIPVSASPIDSGTLVVRDGKIASIGASGSVRIPRGARTVDVSGAVIIPGLVDSHSHIGEVAGGDSSAPLAPETRALDSINIRDAGFKRARAGGITSVNLMAGSGLLMSGQTIYVKLREGNTIEALAYRTPDGRIAGGMKMANGTNSRGEPPFPGTRAKSASLVRQQFVAAQEYRDKIRRADGDVQKLPERNLGLEALVEVLDGERVVHHHTHRHDDIVTALRLREEFGYRVVLHHVSEADRVAGEIAAANVPVSLILVDSPGGKLEAMNLNFGSPPVLEKAGVKVGFHTDDYITDSRLFLRMGAIAVRTGMSREKAIEGLTLANARILGLDERIGSLEKDKDADFVVLSGDPFSVYTRVLQTWVEGKKVFDLDDPDDRAVAEGAYGALTPSSIAYEFHGYGEGHR